jgi:hypothetical protein
MCPEICVVLAFALSFVPVLQAAITAALSAASMGQAVTDAKIAADSVKEQHETYALRVCLNAVGWSLSLSTFLPVFASVL